GEQNGTAHHKRDPLCSKGESFVMMVGSDLRSVTLTASPRRRYFTLRLSLASLLPLYSVCCEHEGKRTRVRGLPHTDRFISGQCSLSLMSMDRWWGCSGCDETTDGRNALDDTEPHLVPRRRNSKSSLSCEGGGKGCPRRVAERVDSAA